MEVRLLLFLMSSFPYLFLFSSTLFIRTLIALSSSHWLILWVALEVNIISFLPLISISTQFQETEASIKYFLFQALGSRFLLLGSFNPSLYFLIFIGILVKLGIAPFHFWFPSVINAINWPICLLLTTWQKIVPIFILITSRFFHLSSLILAIASLNALVGGLGGLNQTQIRPLLAYSSIGHIGWILAASSISAFTRSIYFFIYILISTTLFIFLFFIQVNSSNLFSTLVSSNFFAFSILTILLLSLGGLPPLTGFFPKWLVLSGFSNLLTPFILILGSLINLFYYLNICFSSALANVSPIFSKQTYSLSFLRFFILSTLTLPILFFYALILLN